MAAALTHSLTHSLAHWLAYLLTKWLPFKHKASARQCKRSSIVADIDRARRFVFTRHSRSHSLNLDRPIRVRGKSHSRLFRNLHVALSCLLIALTHSPSAPIPIVRRALSSFVASFRSGPCDRLIERSSIVTAARQLSALGLLVLLAILAILL